MGIRDKYEEVAKAAEEAKLDKERQAQKLQQEKADRAKRLSVWLEEESDFFEDQNFKVDEYNAFAWTLTSQLMKISIRVVSDGIELDWVRTRRDTIRSSPQKREQVNGIPKMETVLAQWIYENNCEDR